MAAPITRRGGTLAEVANTGLAVTSGEIEESGRIRVFIADEQPLFREGIRLTLADSLGAMVVGEASSGREALQTIAAASPDICLIDANLPLGGQALGFGDPTLFIHSPENVVFPPVRLIPRLGKRAVHNIKDNHTSVIEL